MATVSEHCPILPARFVTRAKTQRAWYGFVGSILYFLKSAMGGGVVDFEVRRVDGDMGGEKTIYLRPYVIFRFE